MNDPRISRRSMLASAAVGGAAVLAPTRPAGAIQTGQQPINLDWPDLAIAHGPSLQAPTPDGISIALQTTRPALVWVEYGTGESLNHRAVPAEHGLINPFNRNHIIRLNNLSPNTQYTYRVCAKAFLEYEEHDGRRWAHRVRYGNEIATEPKQFKTLDPEADTFSCYVLQDIHERNDVLQTFLSRMQFDEADFIALNGDMINDFMYEHLNFTCFLDDCVEHFAQTTPIVYSRGNHDVRGHFAPRLHEYMALHNQRAYYSFNHGPVHFVVLDSGEDKHDNHQYYGQLVEYEPYIQQQADWLKQDLASDAARDAAFVVVMFHITPGGSDWHGRQRVQELWLPIFNQARIDLALCGHLHRRVVYEPGEIGNEFPLIVGDWNDMLRVDATPDHLRVTAQHLDADTPETILSRS